MSKAGEMSLGGESTLIIPCRDTPAEVSRGRLLLSPLARSHGGLEVRWWWLPGGAGRQLASRHWFVPVLSV